MYMWKDDIKDIWVFQCKIEFYFTEWTPQENTDCGVHEWNKIQSYIEKKKSNFLFLLCFYLQ